MRWVLRSKIHKANVTGANIDYVGSITIDEALTKRVGIWPGEKVQVVDNTNGARVETYVIPGKAGEVCINGAAAHLIHKGDEVIIMGYELTDRKIKPKKILVDRKNSFLNFL